MSFEWNQINSCVSNDEKTNFSLTSCTRFSLDIFFLIFIREESDIKFIVLADPRLPWSYFAVQSDEYV